MNSTVVSQIHTLDLYNPTNIFYIDNEFNSKDYVIIKINYVKYNCHSLEQIIEYLNEFHIVFIDTYSEIQVPKIIIVIDAILLKNSIQISSGSMYNINLINLIKQVSNTYDAYIEKCLIINYTDIDKGLICVFKTLFKHINFVQKINVYDP
tara:strand:- start:1594 stop:2046 length:453 start_codon:yes stop_codon:yes gene_type:complete